jgi:hypothetical protein
MKKPRRLKNVAAFFERFCSETTAFAGTQVFLKYYSTGRRYSSESKGSVFQVIEPHSSHYATAAPLRRSSMRKRTTVRLSLITFTVLVALFLSLLISSAQVGKTPRGTAPNRPAEIDVRGRIGVPEVTPSRSPSGIQLKNIGALGSRVGKPLQLEYNDLTATPSHLFSYGTYLTAPSADTPEAIARNFISQWREIFRFSDDDVSSLRLRSRTTIPDMGTTILLFEQMHNGIPVYKGEVLVNVNRSGQIMSVGGESFPQMAVNDTYIITPEQAIAAAAASLGISNFAPQSLGTKKVLTTYGNLTREYVDAPRYSGKGVFTDEIVVSKTIFPMGDTGRPAYNFVLTTPQYSGIMWNNVVDAQTGAVLRRTSLTSFVGPPGGGQGVGRRGTFRPDIQNMIEALNAGSTAVGKVFDAAPALLSGVHQFGKSNRTGISPSFIYTTPTYAVESPLPTDANGRGFRYTLAQARNENPLSFNSTPGTFTQAQLTGLLGQVTRGFPDATNPSPYSPFGWFYLPTNNGGAEITSANGNRTTTRAFGYTMAAEAQSRNLAANSPVGDKSQPYSVTVTPLASSATLADGRVLSSVIQSNYTEGNNVIVADDHTSDDEATHGVKGYSSTRHFDAGYFDFINDYEYSAVDAGGTPFFPASTNADVYPGTTSLFMYTNLMHDYLYSIGFTEATWNFQQDNFGKGGAGGDALSAQVQDGSGTDNANMGTPNDGSYPRMQMYLFTQAGFRRSDGSFDFDVVGHEFYHGVSNRSAGKGQTDCLGTPLVGESGGMGEGWSDFIASSMTDDDSEGEYVTGEYDIGIRRLPYTNYRWSYGSLNGASLNRRDNRPPTSAQPPDVVVGGIPFEVHDGGELWGATLWDMRELMIVKQKVGVAFPGVFFDHTRRGGGGASFYIGERLFQSVDALHPIEYRASFNDSSGTTPTINAANHIQRPGMVATEIASLGNRNGPLATALSNGARLADTITLRGLQLAPCNPSFVDMRNSMLSADTELSGGENRAVIWRAFASHGVGTNATSSNSGSGGAGAVVEDFSVPADVTTCETAGPLAAPSFSLSTPANNAVLVTIPAVAGAATKIISRSSSANGPFAKIAEIPNATTTYNDNAGGAGLPGGQTLFYQVRVSRNPECISSSTTQSITVTGPVVTPAPIFAGLDQVGDPHDGTRLILSWLPAVSLNPSASIVYDIYRVTAVTPGNSTQDPTFTPSVPNRITPAGGVTGTSFANTGLALGQIYYYIVQARDTNNGLIDTNNTGNRVTKWNAPVTDQITATPPFALDTFENSADNSRFTPQLTESGTNPNQNSATLQRITGANLSGLPLTDGKLYAPDFSPGDEADGCTTSDPGGIKCGGQSDFAALIGPFTGANTLTSTSIMQFDNFINAERNFDGGVIEIGVGAPPAPANSTPFPDNVTTFDAGDYIIGGYYNGHLDGSLPACPPVGSCFGSALQGRRAFSGVKALHQVQIALGSFAPGGVRNPSSLPVYIRFRMTSDVASANGVDSGWIIDNLVINNLAVACTPSNVALASNGSTAVASSTYGSRNYSPGGAIDGEHKGLNWENGGGWNDATRDVYPDSLEVDFAATNTINQIRVYTVQNDFNNPVEPDANTPADYYGILDFDVQYWNGAGWLTIPGGSVTGNDKAMRVFSFPDLATTKIRVVINNARNHFSRITEIEAIGCP